MEYNCFYLFHVLVGGIKEVENAHRGGDSGEQEASHRAQQEEQCQ